MCLERRASNLEPPILNAAQVPGRYGVNSQGVSSRGYVGQGGASATLVFLTDLLYAGEE